MGYIIVLRNPTTGKLLSIVETLVNGETDCIAEFNHSHDAQAFANNNPLCKAWDYQILEVDEL